MKFDYRRQYRGKRKRAHQLHFDRNNNSIVIPVEDGIEGVGIAKGTFGPELCPVVLGFFFVGWPCWQHSFGGGQFFFHFQSAAFVAFERP